MRCATCDISAGEKAAPALTGMLASHCAAGTAWLPRTSTVRTSGLGTTV